MKKWPSWVVLVLTVVGLLAYGSTKDAGARTPEERIEEISKRLACPICDGESVYESQNPSSAAIRAAIRTQVAEGTASDDQIVGAIVEAFGADTQLVPKATGFEALVWVLPAAALVCAAVGLFVAFRRWKAAADTVPDDDDRALVAAALADDDIVEPVE